MRVLLVRIKLMFIRVELKQKRIIQILYYKREAQGILEYIEELKKKLKVYNKQTGLLYRNAGCQESNNYCELTKRFKRRRMSWTEKGATNLVKVITTIDSESCNDIFEYLKVDVSVENYKEFVDKHIEETE